MVTWELSRPACLVSLLAAATLAASLGPLGSARSQDKPPAKPLTDLETLVQGNNQFAFDLYARLAKKDGNVVFSPYSISSALAMTFGGARGQTGKQMASVMRFGLPQQRLHAAFGGVAADLRKDDLKPPLQLHIANALWGQEGFPFLEGFLELNQKNYDAGLKLVDFAGNPDRSRETINRWIEEQTRDKIRDLLNRDDINSRTRLVLTNAVYMKANWEEPFDKDQTKLGVFAVSDARRPEVPMIRRAKGFFQYFKSDDLELLKLSYKGKRVSMVLLLPRFQSLAELERMLTPAILEHALAKSAWRTGSVSFPRFKTANRIDLASDLSRMGMPLAFSPAADFSGINSGSGLSISHVIQKAFVDVDETGTEAAAATAVVLGVGPIVPFEFHANSPFLFLIRDNSTGTILFMGRVSDPSR